MRDKLINLYLYADNYIQFINLFHNSKWWEFEKCAGEVPQGVNIITIYDDNFPQKLKENKLFPPLLFYKGDIRILDSNCAWVFTNDHPSYYARRVMSVIKLQEYLIGMENLDLSEAIYDIIYCNNIEIINEKKCQLAVSIGYPLSWYNIQILMSILGSTVYVLERKISSQNIKLIDTVIDNHRNIKCMPTSLFKEDAQLSNWLISCGANMICIKTLMEKEVDAKTSNCRVTSQGKNN